MLRESWEIKDETEWDMKMRLKKVTLHTTKPVQAIDITPEIHKAVKENPVNNGMVFILTLHTTAGLVVTEKLPCLEQDVLETLEKLIPEHRDYHHNRYLESYGRLGINAASHLRSIIAGTSLFFPIQGSEIVMGNAQNVYFLEFDGPVKRTYCIQMMGE